MKCIIIEDELPAQRVVQHYISKLGELELIGSFQSALEANNVLQNNAVDLVFLDINLPDISGIQYIKTLSGPPRIIMTTAYPEHAAESFELDTICDYLVKPFSFERFLKAVNKAKKIPASTMATEGKNSGNAIFINIDKTLHRIIVADILYIESDKNYVTIATKTGRFSYLDSLKNWKVKLQGEPFIQVHKSYLINFREVEKVVGNLVHIKDKKIPIGRVYKSGFLKKLS